MEAMTPLWALEEAAWQNVFNTPIECGLRLVVLLSEMFPSSCDLQRLIYYDYLLVHSGDVPGGLPSIHPGHPFRAGELYVRRQLIERGLSMMLSKSIIVCSMTPEGIHYQAGEWAIAFLESLNSEYTRQLVTTAKWISDQFAATSDEKLSSLLASRSNEWGAEFSYSTLAISEFV